jgi:putative DNA primase/helicase
MLHWSRTHRVSHGLGWGIVFSNRFIPNISPTPSATSPIPNLQPQHLSATLKPPGMPKQNQADESLALLRHANDALPFPAQDGRPCVTIAHSTESNRTLPLRSADFRDWLTARYYSQYQAAPSTLALRSVLRTLEARAQTADSPRKNVDHRVSFEGDRFAPSKIFLDLANADAEVLEITPRGWTITNNFQRSFRQSTGMLNLPSPQSNPQPPKPNPLQTFTTLFHLSPTAQIRTLAWLAAALRPIGPYPILVLRGPASSGKSALARAIRTLIDPSAAPIRRLPIRDRELLQLALHNWILVFDHVHRIPIKISEALCAVSSGEAIQTAQPDFRDPALTEIARPIILIAPLDEAQSPWTPTRSLANRTLTIDLAPIATPRPEADVSRDFDALRTPALATLADAVSSALRNIREIDLGYVARFSDALAWAAAAAPVLGLNPAALIETVADPESMWLGTDPLRDTLYTLLRTNPSWSGAAATLLTELRAIAPLATLPSTPKGLSQSLARIPGITVSHERGHLRTLSVSKITDKLRHQTQNHP